MLKDVGRPRYKFIRQIRYRDLNLAVLANEDVGWRLIRKKRYEENELDFVQSFVKSDDICVDVGAYIGIYTIIMGEIAYNGKIIAFEPISLNQKILALNLNLNTLNNVDLRSCVISDKKGQESFAVSVDSAYSSILSTSRKQDMHTISVQASTLDEELKNIKKPIGLIKIDVEGAELLVLKGASSLFSDPKRRPRGLLVELEKKNMVAYGYQPTDVIGYMRQFDYHAFSLTSQGLIPGWPHDDGTENVVFLNPGVAPVGWTCRRRK